MSLAKQSSSQRKSFQQKLNAVANVSVKLTAVLVAAIAWATKMEIRLNEAIQNAITDFNQRKSAWGLDVESNEKPHAITEQVVKSGRFKKSAYAALLLESVIAAFRIWGTILFYIPNPTIAFIVSLFASLFITFGLAITIHGALLSIFDTPENPVNGFKRLKSFIIFPTLLMMIIAIAGYAGISTLDATTLLWAGSAISWSIYVAIFGFWGLGTGLLVAADIYGWSQTVSEDCESIEDELQVVINAKREWQEKLDDISNVNNNQLENKLTENTLAQKQAVPVLIQNNVETAPAVSTNNHSSNGVATSVLGLLLIASSLLFTACVEPQIQIKKVPVTEKVTLDYIVDASGVENKEALREAGLHIRESLPKIIEQSQVTDLNVFWFAENGWNAIEKSKIQIPAYNKVEVVLPKQSSEVVGVSPKIIEALEEMGREVLKKATDDEAKNYRNQIEQSLASINTETILPPPSVESFCTDINGMLGRFTQPLSVSKHIILVVSDGRQNCNGENLIKKITVPENTRIIFVVVSGTVNVGQDDFELRSKRFKDACPTCKTLPHYSKELETLFISQPQIAEAKAQ
jgi:hypothetical protein